MAVTSIEELRRLVEEGWVPYFHRGVRRWYVRKGHKTEIVSVHLEPYAEDIAARIPRERNKVTPEVAARVVELRKNGELIGSISDRLGLPHRTVENILDRYESGTLEMANPISVVAGSILDSPPEKSFDLLEEVEQYVQRLALKVVAEPEKKQLPGYRSEAYIIPIEDVETGKRLMVVYPLPTYRAEGYETVTITNMEGKKVKVVALKGNTEVQEQGSENPLEPFTLPLIVIGAVGVGIAATLIDKFVGPLLGWNPEGRWWWERAFNFS